MSGVLNLGGIMDMLLGGFFGASLVICVVLACYAEGKTQMGRTERKLNLLLRHHGIDPLQELPLSDRVNQLASDPAHKIEAIKAYREETGASLKESKDAIEAFINSK